MIPSTKGGRKRFKKLPPNPKLPPNMGKLLVYGALDENYLAYELGKNGIYLDHVDRVETTNDERLIPKIAIVRYPRDLDMDNFITTTTLQVLRIFKHAVFTKTVRTKAFFYSVANNLLGLAAGHVIRVKSNSMKLRDELYKIFETVNKEGKFNCAFDYDDYEVVVDLKVYIAGPKTYMIVTTSGLDDVVVEKVKESD